MSGAISVILSDSDSEQEQENNILITTPKHKRQKINKISTPPKSVYVIDDDTPMLVPRGILPDSDVAIVKCTTRVSHDTGARGLIFLESDDEFEKEHVATELMQSKSFGFACNVDKYPVVCDVENYQEFSRRPLGSSFSLEDENLTQTSVSSSYLHSSGDVMTQVNDRSTEDNNGWENNTVGKESKSKATAGGNRKKKTTEEEKIRLKEEKKQQKEREKLQKEAMKAEAAKLKKLQKEKQKWEKGKFALKSLVAEIDPTIIEKGSIAGPLLTRFAEKGLTYKITKNPIGRSIIWNMTVPEELSQLSSEGTEISYVLVVFEAEEFCELIMNNSVMDHVSLVRSRYPSHTVCYLINRLMAYINKREQIQYKNPEKSSGWRRPPVEEVLAKLTTHFDRVHSRLCVDEAELAEHIVRLTGSLGSCFYRKKLTRLSVNANGSIVPKDCVDKNLIKKNTWLKALVAIPKVQPRFAIAIWKKYATMKSLLSVYMDPNKSVHEKEFLLEDLRIEVTLGEDRRLGEICSKRVYRILMAQCGTIKTDEVEDGADLFRSEVSNTDESYFADDLSARDCQDTSKGPCRGTKGK